MSPALRISITPSVRLGAFLCVVHVAAAAATWAAPVPAGLQAALTVAISVSLAWGLWSAAALKAAQAIVAVEITEDGRISFRTRHGAWHPCELLPSSYVSPHLTILNLRAQGGWRARHVVLMSDNIDADGFRRLRTWLRWSSQTGARSGAGNT